MKREYESSFESRSDLKNMELMRFFYFRSSYGSKLATYTPLQTLR